MDSDRELTSKVIVPMLIAVGACINLAWLIISALQRQDIDIVGRVFEISARQQMISKALDEARAEVAELRKRVDAHCRR